MELLEEPTRFEEDLRSEAKKRNVTIPPHITPVLQQRATEFVGTDYFFVDRYDTRVRSNTIYQAFVHARRKVGVDISLNDLKHIGQSLWAATGAGLVDLQQRGHSPTATASGACTHWRVETQITKALSEIAIDGDATKLPKSFEATNSDLGIF